LLFGFALLKQRGMLMKDEQKAVFYLNQISYCHLKVYWWDMQTDRANLILPPFLTLKMLLPVTVSTLNPDNEIKNKLLTLFNAHPEMPIYKMGFFNNWQCELSWR
jgi:hypothetical protein